MKDAAQAKDVCMKLYLAALLLAASPLAAAEPPSLDRRVGTLETQMKAVQRKVFPGGDPRYFSPEIAPEAPAAPVEGTPATSALTDLTARVDALERQQRNLTGALEEAQNKLHQLDEAFTKYRGDTDFRLNAIEHPTPPAAAAPPPDAAAAAAPADEPTRTPRAARPAKADTPPPLSVEDQWRAAYALYTAKDYAGAAGAMTDFLAANPKAARASNAAILAGPQLYGAGSICECGQGLPRRLQEISDRRPRAGKPVVAGQCPRGAEEAEGGVPGL